MVVTTKDESQNGCCKETKRVKFSEKQSFLNPLIRTEFGVLCFLETLVLRFQQMKIFRKVNNKCNCNMC